MLVGTRRGQGGAARTPLFKQIGGVFYSLTWFCHNQKGKWWWCFLYFLWYDDGFINTDGPRLNAIQYCRAVRKYRTIAQDKNQ